MTNSSQDVEKTYACLVKPKLDNHLLEVHQQKSKKVKPFTCEFCSREFPFRSKLESHTVEKHVVDKEYECHICSMTFIDHQTLEKHRKGHDRELAYICDVCSKGFRSKGGLNYHLKVKHSQSFYCTKCLRSFKNKTEFDEHLNPKTGLDFKCGICYEILNSRWRYDIHTNSHLKEIKVEKDPIKINKTSLDQEKVKVETVPESESTQELAELVRLRCGLCLKIFDRENHLRAHRNQVHPKAEWTCETCFKIFMRYYRLKQHRKVHLREIKSLVCPVCTEAFGHSKDLAKHEESHDVEETEHKCQLCCKYFKSVYYLKKHKAKAHVGF